MLNSVKGHIEFYNLEAALKILESSLHRYVNIDPIVKPVEIRVSIALQDCPIGTGTLGSYVRLIDSKLDLKMCAMACHHVLESRNATLSSR